MHFIELKLCEKMGDVLIESKKMYKMDDFSLIIHWLASDTFEGVIDGDVALCSQAKTYIARCFMEENKDCTDYIKEAGQISDDALFWLGYLFTYWCFEYNEQPINILTGYDIPCIVDAYDVLHTLSIKYAIDLIKEDYALDINEAMYISIFNRIYDMLVTDTAKQQNHAVLFLGGQPGVGKSTFYSMDESLSSYIVIDGDQYRKYHPDYDKMSMENVSQLTQGLVNRLVEDLIDKLGDEGYNLVIEGTLRDAQVPIKTASLLKEKGYSTELFVVTCDACLSWEACKNRAEVMENISGSKPRMVSAEKYNAIVSALPDNMQTILESSCMDKIQIIDREYNVMWSSLDKTNDLNLSEFMRKSLNIEEWTLKYNELCNDREQHINRRRGR